MDDVGVAAAELQREGGLIAQAPEVVGVAAARDQNAHRAVAYPQADDGGPPNLRGHDVLHLAERLRRQLGAHPQRRPNAFGELLVARQLDETRAIDVDDVQRGPVCARGAGFAQHGRRQTMGDQLGQQRGCVVVGVGDAICVGVRQLHTTHAVGARTA